MLSALAVALPAAERGAGWFLELETDALGERAEAEERRAFTGLLLVALIGHHQSRLEPRRQEIQERIVVLRDRLLDHPPPADAVSWGWADEALVSCLAPANASERCADHALKLAVRMDRIAIGGQGGPWPILRWEPVGMEGGAFSLERLVQAMRILEGLRFHRHAEHVDLGPVRPGAIRRRVGDWLLAVTARLDARDPEWWRLPPGRFTAEGPDLDAYGDPDLWLQLCHHAGVPMDDPSLTWLQGMRIQSAARRAEDLPLDPEALWRRRATWAVVADGGAHRPWRHSKRLLAHLRAQIVKRGCADDEARWHAAWTLLASSPGLRPPRHRLLRRGDD